jgi:acyl-CoA thioesterase-1
MRRRAVSWPVRLLGVVAVVVASGCGGSPTRPSAPTSPPAAPGPPARPAGLECPATVVAESLTGGPVPVQYPLPIWGDGAPLGSVTCVPPPGSLFPLGTTTVACVAREASGEFLGCTFEVRVVRPRLTVTRFLAFGDSLTAGEVAPPLPSVFPVIDPQSSYPARLLARLQARYPGQPFEVTNAGVPGEQAVEGAERLPNTLRAVRPEALLLMEGTNDLFFYRQEAAARALPALERMVQIARSAGVGVVLGTIPPQRPGGMRDEVARLIPGFNDEVRALARRYQVPLADVFEELRKDLSLIGDDDLHPTARGYDVMAGVFFETIKAVYEVAPTSSAVR